MTDLTEQWKKGKLTSGWYWCKCYNEETKLIYYDGDCFELDDPETKNYYFFLKKDGAEIAILAKVPSYEEYQKLKESRAELNSDIADKAYENAMLKSEYEKECHRADELEDSYWKEVEKNKKLKELLKECVSSIQYYQETYGAMDLDTYTLLAKLKEVLK